MITASTDAISFCVHVRKKKPSEVVAAISETTGLAAVTTGLTGARPPKRRKRHLAVSAAHQGWVSVLDSHNAAADSLAAQLSRALATDVFAIVSRGDRSRESPSWQYSWFRQEQLIDSYDSASLKQPWDETELDDLMELWQKDPAAAIERQRAQAESSETALTPERAKQFALLIETKNWQTHLAKILDDESANSTPDCVVADFLNLLGIHPGYAGISYAWLFHQDQDPKDLIHTGIRFVTHLA